jgi:hypothetical protein
MRRTWGWLRWGLAAIVFLLLIFLALPLVSFHQGDSLVAQAADRMQVGMTDTEVQQTLLPITSTARIIDEDGEVQYQFYGVDEFVTVVLQPDGSTRRVVTVQHVPDVSPPRERYRRRWETRLH